MNRMSILFNEKMPENFKKITIKWNDETEDDYIWVSRMTVEIDWNQTPYPIAWKLKEE